MAVGAQGVGEDEGVGAVVLVAREAVAGAQRLDVAAGDDDDPQAGLEQGIDDRAVGSLDGHALDARQPADQLPQPGRGVLHLEAGGRPCPCSSMTHTACRALAQSMPAYRRIPSISCLLAVAAAWGHPRVTGRVRRSLTDRRSMARSPIAARHVPARRTPRNSCWPSSGERGLAVVRRSPGCIGGRRPPTRRWCTSESAKEPMKHLLAGSPAVRIRHGGTGHGGTGMDLARFRGCCGLSRRRAPTSPSGADVVAPGTYGDGVGLG